MAADSPLRGWLGRRVEVVIDRPLGSAHPRHPDIVYPVNYGFVPGTEASDGHEVDVYVLGVDVPVATFTGVVIGVVVRENDVEDKLVAARAATGWSAVEIAAAVAFQERFFTIRIVTAGTT